MSVSPWYYLLVLVEAPLLYWLAWMGGWPYFLLIAVVAMMGMSELYSHLVVKGARPDVGVGCVCGLLVLAAGEFTPLQVWPVVAVGVLLLTMAGSLCAQFTRTGRGDTVRDAALTALGVLYVALPMSFFFLLCKLDIPLLVDGHSAGRAKARLGALLVVTLSVWLCDTAAWAVGHLIGRVKLVPRLSPNKTVEGAVAGGIAAVVATTLLGTWAGLPIHHGIVLGLLIAVGAQLGDLAESVIKRDLGLKDFGTVVGPHGGMLDTFDSLLFAAPLTWFYLWLALTP
ncbi:MAG TPA: CDP-archaeol synthase [Armatimonadota bacterium]|nr:CDP-archaeol synthase [Armatimonadota bacterium]